PSTPSSKRGQIDAPSSATPASITTLKPPTADPLAMTTIAENAPAQNPDPPPPRKAILSPRQDRAEASIEPAAPRPDKGIETTPAPTTHLQAAIIEPRLPAQ